MEVLEYQGRNVYTSSYLDIQVKDLDSSEATTGRIEDAYFFELGMNRSVQIEFNRKKVENGSSGLMIRVKGTLGTATVSIVGLQRIVDFMCDFDCIGKDLSTLKGREVRKYDSMRLLAGISKV
ncbi:MAG: hypothetical protein AABX23_02100 [Nanoarchaeota archaeon]